MSLTYNDNAVFNSATTLDPKVVELGTDKILVAYADGGNSNYGTCRLGTKVDGEWTFGIKYVFKSYSVSKINLILLETGKVAISYKATRLESIISTITDSSLSFGSLSTFLPSTGVNDIRTNKIDSTHFLATYNNSSNIIYSTVATVSGTSISYTAEQIIYSGGSYNTSFATDIIDSTHILYVYSTSYQTESFCTVGTISGSSISTGTHYKFSEDRLYFINVSVISSSSFIITYINNNNIYSTLGNISNIDELSYSYDHDYSIYGVYLDLTLVDSNTIYMTYSDYNNNYLGSSILATITDSSILAEDPIVYNSDSSTYIDNNIGEEGAVYVVYRDYGNSSYGTLSSGTISVTVEPIYINEENILAFENIETIETGYVEPSYINEENILVFENIETIEKGFITYTNEDNTLVFEQSETIETGYVEPSYINEDNILVFEQSETIETGYVEPVYINEDNILVFENNESTYLATYIEINETCTLVFENEDTIDFMTYIFVDCKSHIVDAINVKSHIIDEIVIGA